MFADAGGSGAVAVVDRLGGVALADRARHIVSGTGSSFLSDLESAIDEAAVNLGLGQMIPRVSVVCGPRLLDLSDARRAEDVISAAADAVAEHSGTVVAVIAR